MEFPYYSPWVVKLGYEYHWGTSINSREQNKSVIGLSFLQKITLKDYTQTQAQSNCQYIVCSHFVYAAGYLLKNISDHSSQ